MNTNITIQNRSLVLHPNAQILPEAVGSSLKARLLNVLVQSVAQARRQNGANLTQEAILNHCNSFYGAGFAALRNASGDEQALQIARRLVLHLADFDLQRDFINRFTANFSLNAQVDACENLRSTATEALLGEIRQHNPNVYENLMQNSLRAFADQQEVFGAFRRMSILGGNNLERFQVLSNQGASLLSLFICGGLGKSRNPHAYATAAFAGGVIGLVQAGSGLWAQLRHESRAEVLQQVPHLAWQITKSTLIGSLSGIAECAGSRYISSALVRFFAAEVGGEVLATNLLDKLGQTLHFENERHFEAGFAASFLANATEEKMGGAHSLLVHVTLNRSSNIAFGFSELALPVFQRVHAAAISTLATSSLLFSNIAHAATPASANTGLLASCMGMIMGLSFLLLRRKPDASAEAPLGQYWNRYNQSTHVEEALAMIESQGLEAARQHLETHNVHLVTVLGSGRHGTGLDKMSVQVTQATQQLQGKSVVHVLLTHEAENDRAQADSMNYKGTNTFVGGNQINTKEGLALHASDPKYNEALLSLADTVIVSLPTAALPFALNQNRIQNFKANAQLLVGMKSVQKDGSGIPFSVYLALAQSGRFDLMLNLTFQTGLGFPEEMVGHDSPTGPIKFTLDSISRQARMQAARLFVGDQGNINIAAEIATAENKYFNTGTDPFLSAYLAYMKNVLAPDIGYRFCDWLIKGRAGLKPYELEEQLCDHRKKAREELVEIFLNHEATKINAERKAILAAINAYVETHPSLAENEHLQTLREYFSQEQSWNRESVEQAFNHNETGIEDLKGCTRVRNEESFLKIINNVLNSEGLAFEEAFAGMRHSLKKLASSTNFFAGIERRINEELVRLGKVSAAVLQERDQNTNKTIEGLYAIPSLGLRWSLSEENLPEFVKRILAWKDQAYPEAKIRLHISGMTWQSLVVIRDYIRRLQDARTEAYRDLSDANTFRASINNVRQVLQQFITFLKAQNDLQALLPANKNDLAVVISDVNDLLIELNKIDSRWGDSVNLMDKLGSGLISLSDRFRNVRRDRAAYQIRNSISERLEAFFVQLEKEFKMEENNLAHWISVRKKIKRMFIELDVLRDLERMSRHSENG